LIVSDKELTDVIRRTPHAAFSLDGNGNVSGKKSQALSVYSNKSAALNDWGGGKGVKRK